MIRISSPRVVLLAVIGSAALSACSSQTANSRYSSSYDAVATYEASRYGSAACDAAYEACGYVEPTECCVPCCLPVAPPVYMPPPPPQPPIIEYEPEPQPEPPVYVPPIPEPQPEPPIYVPPSYPPAPSPPPYLPPRK
eukprot:GHVU01006802.1.p1 GENE.GHVU01006802.1~~GHVU01006802.1.p1  ORF type:complete len:138 (-),score=9.08 GHVU01006802.1:84-497(-)